MENQIKINFGGRIIDGETERSGLKNMIIQMMI